MPTERVNRSPQLIAGVLDKPLARSLEQCLAGQPSEGWGEVRTGSVARVYGSDDYYIKILDPHRAGWLAQVAMGRRLRRILAKDQGMARAGFRVPELVAAGRCNGTGFIITRTFEGTSLAHWSRALPYAEKRDLFHALGEEVARLHAAGIYHGDLNPFNILARKEGAGFVFAFLDNEQNQALGFFVRSRALSNLSRLNRRRNVYRPSRTLKRIFLKAYLARLGRADTISWWWDRLAKAYAADLTRPGKPGARRR